MGQVALKYTLPEIEILLEDGAIQTVEVLQRLAQRHSGFRA